jgi:vacuolar-type H+-ATPase subunit I/STV1
MRIKNIPLYFGGTAKNAGYVRKMEKLNQIQFHKISRPSQWMINKYGNNQIHVQEPHYEDFVPDVTHHNNNEPRQLFNDNENLDFNVGTNKKKKKKNNNKGPTESQQEREEKKRQDKIDQLTDLLNDTKEIKNNVAKYKLALQKEKNTYNTVLEEVNQNKERLKKLEKENKKQQVIQKHLANNKKIKEQYNDVIQYIKDNKLSDDLNSINNHIRTKIKNLEQEINVL